MRPMDVRAVCGHEQPVVGMVHLPALPGSPGYGGDREAVREEARADALALADGGCDAVLVENYGDTPYHPESVPTHVVADLAAAVESVTDEVDLPHGVNVLRNDAQAALSVAAATGGSFVRVNVHTGTRATDQGLLEGRAHETLRLRERIDAEVAILADVAVKHSGAVADRDLARLARETVDRGLADGLVASGAGTGEATAGDHLRRVLDGRDDATREVPVFVGSGARPETARNLLEVADGLIVGTALKRDGETAAAVERERVRDLLDALGRNR
jgi:membrane complex biogenesis BtpA family protein